MRLPLPVADLGGFSPYPSDPAAVDKALTDIVLSVNAALVLDFMVQWNGAGYQLWDGWENHPAHALSVEDKKAARSRLEDEGLIDYDLARSTFATDAGLALHSERQHDLNTISASVATEHNASLGLPAPSVGALRTRP